MAYKHATTLSSSGSAASYTFSPRPFEGMIAVQCSGGDARLAFGTGSATAVNNQGLRVIADTQAQTITLAPGEDTVSMIVDENSSGTVKLEIMTAPLGFNR